MTSKEENKMKQQVRQGLRQGKWAPQCLLIQNHDGWLESVVSTASKSLVFAGAWYAHTLGYGSPCDRWWQENAQQSWNLLQLLQLVYHLLWLVLCTCSCCQVFDPETCHMGCGWGVIRFWRTSIFEMKTTCPHPMCFGFKTPQNFKIVSKIPRNH